MLLERSQRRNPVTKVDSPWVCAAGYRGLGTRISCSPA